MSNTIIILQSIGILVLFMFLVATGRSLSKALKVKLALEGLSSAETIVLDREPGSGRITARCDISVPTGKTEGQGPRRSMRILAVEAGDRSEALARLAAKVRDAEIQHG